MLEAISNIDITDKKEKQEVRNVPKTFSDKVIGFNDEPEVQCDVPVVKHTFVVNGDIQMVTKTFDRNT